MISTPVGGCNRQCSSPLMLRSVRVYITKFRFTRIVHCNEKRRYTDQIKNNVEPRQILTQLCYRILYTVLNVFLPKNLFFKGNYLCLFFKLIIYFFITYILYYIIVRIICILYNIIQQICKK